MSQSRKFRVFATATHCAVIEIVADNAEEAAAIAGKLDGSEFDILHVHADSIEVQEVILLQQGEHAEENGQVVGTPVH